eukprot:PhF_6_TR42677/c0_g1_i1/m.64347
MESSRRSQKIKQFFNNQRQKRREIVMARQLTEAEKLGIRSRTVVALGKSASQDVSNHKKIYHINTDLLRKVTLTPDELNICSRAYDLFIQSKSNATRSIQQIQAILWSIGVLVSNEEVARLLEEKQFDNRVFGFDDFVELMTELKQTCLHQFETDRDMDMREAFAALGGNMSTDGGIAAEALHNCLKEMLGVDFNEVSHMNAYGDLENADEYESNEPKKSETLEGEEDVAQAIEDRPENLLLLHLNADERDLDPTMVRTSRRFTENYVKGLQTTDLPVEEFGADFIPCDVCKKQLPGYRWDDNPATAVFGKGYYKNMLGSMTNLKGGEASYTAFEDVNSPPQISFPTFTPQEHAFDVSRGNASTWLPPAAQALRQTRISQQLSQSPQESPSSSLTKSPDSTTEQNVNTLRSLGFFLQNPLPTTTARVAEIASALSGISLVPPEVSSMRKAKSALKASHLNQADCGSPASPSKRKSVYLEDSVTSDPEVGKKSPNTLRGLVMVSRAAGKFYPPRVRLNRILTTYDIEALKREKYLWDVFMKIILLAVTNIRLRKQQSAIELALESDEYSDVRLKLIDDLEHEKLWLNWHRRCTEVEDGAKEVGSATYSELLRDLDEMLRDLNVTPPPEPMSESTEHSMERLSGAFDSSAASHQVKPLDNLSNSSSDNQNDNIQQIRQQRARATRSSFLAPTSSSPPSLNDLDTRATLAARRQFEEWKALENPDTQDPERRLFYDQFAGFFDKFAIYRQRNNVGHFVLSPRKTNRRKKKLVEPNTIGNMNTTEVGKVLTTKGGEDVPGSLASPNRRSSTPQLKAYTARGERIVETLPFLREIDAILSGKNNTILVSNSTPNTSNHNSPLSPINLNRSAFRTTSFVAPQASSHKFVQNEEAVRLKTPLGNLITPWPSVNYKHSKMLPVDDTVVEELRRKVTLGGSAAKSANHFFMLLMEEDEEEEEAPEEKGNFMSLMNTHASWRSKASDEGQSPKSGVSAASKSGSRSFRGSGGHRASNTDRLIPTDGDERVRDAFQKLCTTEGRARDVLFIHDNIVVLPMEKWKISEAHTRVEGLLRPPDKPAVCTYILPGQVMSPRGKSGPRTFGAPVSPRSKGLVLPSKTDPTPPPIPIPPSRHQQCSKCSPQKDHDADGMSDNKMPIIRIPKEMRNKPKFSTMQSRQRLHEGFTGQTKAQAAFRERFHNKPSKQL